MPGPAIQPQPLPWYADPKGASIMDPLYITLLRKAASLSGLDTPEGQVLGSAMPAPIAMAGNSARRRLLIEMLNKFQRSPLSPEVEQEAIRNATMAARSTPRRGLPSQAFLGNTPNTARYDAWTKLTQDTPKITPGIERVSSPEELATITPPVKATGGPLPPSGGLRKTGQVNTSDARKRVTPDTVKDIRGLGMELARKKYPDIAYNTLLDIVRRSSWSWVKD